MQEEPMNYGIYQLSNANVTDIVASSEPSSTPFFFFFIYILNIKINEFGRARLQKKLASTSQLYLSTVKLEAFHLNGHRKYWVYISIRNAVALKVSASCCTPRTTFAATAVVLQPLK